MFSFGKGEKQNGLYPINKNMRMRTGPRGNRIVRDIPFYPLGPGYSQKNPWVNSCDILQGGNLDMPGCVWDKHRNKISHVGHFEYPIYAPNTTPGHPNFRPARYPMG